MIRQRFIAGVVDWTPNLPARAWGPVERTVGQTLLTATGVPDGERLTQDSLLTITLRIEEAEWPTAEAMIRYGLSSQAIEWYPDADTTTAFLVYLESPSAGEPWGPRRSAELPRILEMDLVLRGVLGVAPWSPFFVPDP